MYKFTSLILLAALACTTARAQITRLDRSGQGAPQQVGQPSGQASQAAPESTYQPSYVPSAQPNYQTTLQAASQTGGQTTDVARFRVSEDAQNIEGYLYKSMEIPVGAANLWEVDYTNLVLPSLNVLFESARNNPNVEFYSLRTEEEVSALRTERRSWLKYFRVFGNYTYGSYYAYADADNGNFNYTSPVTGIYSTQQTHYWNVGAGVAIPLDDIFDRRNRIQRQTIRMQQTEMEIEKWYDEQKLRIVEWYTTASQMLATLKVKSEMATVATTQYLVAELDFMNGRLDAGSLSRQKSIQSNAVADFEGTKAQLMNAILKLEILANMKITNRQ